MIPVTVRIFVYREPVDMRRGFDGLALVARDAMGQDPRSGSLFIFSNRRTDKLKVLWWDRNGYCVLYKRFHRAVFELPSPIEDGARSVRIDGQQLARQAWNATKRANECERSCISSVDGERANVYLFRAMREAVGEQYTAIDADLVAAQFDVLDSETHRRALLEALRARDVYRKMIDELKEKVAKLEQGLIGPKSQRFKGESDAQLSLQLLAELLGRHAEADDTAQQLAEELLARAESDAQLADDAGGGDGDGGPGGDQPHRHRRKPTGRKTSRRDVAKLRLEMLPDEVKRLGLDAFERIGEETATTLERRVSSLVEVTVVRPKFRAKSEQAGQAMKLARQEQGNLTTDEPESWITIASPLALPLPRTRVGPSLLANVIVRRFADHLPYNRLENVYEREGMRLGRSTLYGWLDQLRPLFAPLLEAMLADAKKAPYVCVDATGVLVQAPEKCARGHFWVLVAPGRHVLFAFSMKHDKAAVDELLGDYAGYIVADAHAVYDHLYGNDAATEVGCWGHARAYFFKAVASEPELAKAFLDT